MGMCKCGNVIKKVPKSREILGRGKYCSRKCMYAYRERPSGLKYTKHKENPTSFKKGHIPWIKGKIGVTVPWNKGTKGLVKSNSGTFKKGELVEEKNPNWKGNDAGYHALHSWLKRKVGKAKKCINCDSTNKVQWANKSWTYKRDTNDWISLCFNCHRRYDTKNWGAASKKFPEIRKKYA